MKMKTKIMATMTLTFSISLLLAYQLQVPDVSYVITVMFYCLPDCLLDVSNLWNWHARQIEDTLGTKQVRVAIANLLLNHDLGEFNSLTNRPSAFGRCH